jgi:hypothetical protein
MNGEQRLDNSPTHPLAKYLEGNGWKTSSQALGLTLGDDAIVPMLYHETNYDGIRRDYDWFGEARLLIDEKSGVFAAEFSGNTEGYNRFIGAMHRYQLDNQQFWQIAYEEAAMVWKHESLVNASRETVFMVMDHRNQIVFFFENPRVPLFFAATQRLAWLVEKEQAESASGG